MGNYCSEKYLKGQPDRNANNYNSFPSNNIFYNCDIIEEVGEYLNLEKLIKWSKITKKNKIIYGNKLNIMILYDEWCETNIRESKLIKKFIQAIEKKYDGINNCSLSKALKYAKKHCFTEKEIIGVKLHYEIMYKN
jgi:hypothetical protein